jgi:hypothetical protein
MEVEIEVVPAAELRHIPGSLFSLGKIGDDDLQELAGHGVGAAFQVASWHSIEAAEAARILLPDASTWEVVGLLFLVDEDADEDDIVPAPRPDAAPYS